MSSNFDESGGIVPCKTDFGQWWQTVAEVHIEVNITNPPVRRKDVQIDITVNSIKCTISNKMLFQGKLYKMVHSDECLWTIEDDGKLVHIILYKVEHNKNTEIWLSLLDNDGYKPDALTLHNMRQKVDLEHFQIEYPGMDFGSAKLSKCYDKPLV